VRNSSGSNLLTTVVGAAFALTATLPAGPASAQGKAPAFSISSVECDWLDRAELTRLLELELELSVSDEDVPPLTLDLSCGEGEVTIVVRDPERTQQIERTVPAPEIEGPGRERQIALTVAQFAGALWRLREAEAQEAAQQEKPALPGPVPEPEPAPPPAPVPPETPDRAAGMRWLLELGGGLRGRALEAAPLLTGFGELSGVAWLAERVGVLALIAVEGADAKRAGGSIGALAFGAGLGLAGSLARWGRFGLEARLLLVGGYARFEGRAADPTRYRDGSTDGGTGEVRLELDPSIELGRFQLALAIQAGYALPVTIAVVRGDDDVSLSGWWVGAGLRVGVSFEE